MLSRSLNECWQLKEENTYMVEMVHKMIKSSKLVLDDTIIRNTEAIAGLNLQLNQQGKEN